MQTDNDLIKQIRDGAIPFDCLYNKYYSRVCAYCRNRLHEGKKNRAEELAQEALIKAWKAIKDGRFDPEKETSFSAWLFKVVIGLCVDCNRKKVPILISPQKPDDPDAEVDKNFSLEGIASDADPVDEEVVKRLTLQDMYRCIHRLKDHDEMTTILLYYLGELKCREIGEVIGRPTRTVNYLLKRAIQKVKKCLESTVRLAQI